MADIQMQFCKFCFSALPDGNFTLLENYTDVLVVLLLKSDLECDLHVACGSCLLKLMAAYEFKLSCLETNNTIATFASCAGDFPLDILDIYMKKREDKQLVNVLDDLNVCHLCLQIVVGEFMQIQKVNADMLQCYIPEINFRITRDPLLCKACFDSLYTHVSFIKMCAEGKTEINEDNKEAVKVVMQQFAVHVKNEDVKMEATGDEEKIEALVKTEEFIIKPENDSGAIHEDVSKVEKSLAPLQPEHKSTSEVRMYQCNECDYQSNRKGHLTNHQLKHRDVSEVRMYKCSECDFETKRKGSLGRHQLKHVDASKVRMFKCGECNFQTNRKGTLAVHCTRHKDPSEVQMYKCDECDYQTNQKGHLAYHQLKHRDSSEVKMHKCTECDFQTKRKASLGRHLLRHVDAGTAQTYKCSECNFQTKLERRLAVHRARHTKSSKVQMYKCNECEYLTDHKGNFANHALTHRGVSEVRLYQCDECNFRTKHKVSLERHRVTHADASEVQMYNCGTCDYQTKFKKNLSRHLSIYCAR